MTTPMGTAGHRGALEIAAQCKKSVAAVELVASLALALSTVIAVTAVSIGIARADVFAGLPRADSAPIAIALFIGLLLTAMGGFTAMVADGRKQQP
jgi:ABC-type Co2+ transport system permease subunit